MIMYKSLYLSLWSHIVFQILKAGVHLLPCDIGGTSKQCICIFWSYIMCICYILYINPIHTSEHKWAISWWWVCSKDYYCRSLILQFSSNHECIFAMYSVFRPMLDWFRLRFEVLMWIWLVHEQWTWNQREI